MQKQIEKKMLHFGMNFEIEHAKKAGVYLLFFQMPIKILSYLVLPNDSTTNLKGTDALSFLFPTEDKILAISFLLGTFL